MEIEEAMRDHVRVVFPQSLAKEMTAELAPNSSQILRPFSRVRQALRWPLCAVLSLLLSACGSLPETEQPNALEGTTEGFTSSEVYYISPEDVLNIGVWREEELNTRVTVRPDGGITFPLIGDVQAAGLTTDELQELVRKELSAYVPEAVVSVSVETAAGLKIFVTGKVTRPGQFLVGRYVDVLQAITLAGGLTPFANSKQIRVLRRTDQGDKIFYFNYNEIERGKNLEQNIVLRPGDTVIVP